MTLTFKDDLFIFTCEHASRSAPKQARFLWNSEKKRWQTSSHRAAARLREYADESAKNEISRKIIEVTPWAGGTGQIPFPKDKTPYPHQLQSALFALERNRSYLGLDPGLGKTPTAVMITNALASKQPVFVCYVCPPFLVETVKEEFEKWGMRGAAVTLYILPDSMAANSERRKEILKLMGDAKSLSAYTLIIIDEAHRFKNYEAKRTMWVLGYCGIQGLMTFFDKTVFMSGTPMPSRPMELWSILHTAAWDCIDFMSRFQYGQHYCAGFQNEFGHWDFSGASHMSQLGAKVKANFMLRLKKHILKLPPKLEEMIVVSDTMPAEVAKLNSAVLAKISPVDLMQGKFALEVDGELHMPTYRRLLGQAKVPFAADMIKEVLESSDESVLVFAYHKEVITKLSADLAEYKPCTVTGETPMGSRFEMVQEFQAKRSRLFIGNYLAAGVGFTLTAATRVVFVEFDWVPATNEQASDRAHRIGQDQSVLVQYIVFKNSIDKAVLETIFRKNQAIKHV